MALKLQPPPRMFKKSDEKSRRKLTLNRETVRKLSENLTEEQLREVAGGLYRAGGTTDGCTSRTTSG